MQSDAIQINGTTLETKSKPTQKCDIDQRRFALISAISGPTRCDYLGVHGSHNGKTEVKAKRPRNYARPR